MVAQAFKKECQGYANAIKTCPDCYESRLNCGSQPNFFENVCTKPHLIVMAKFDGFPIWPAKLISFNDARRIATVQCFGDHEEADVTFDQCFLFSYEIRRRKDTKQISKLAKGDKVRKIDLRWCRYQFTTNFVICISGSRETHPKHCAQVRIVQSGPKHNSHK